VKHPLRTQVDRFNNATIAGFESSTQMLMIWSGQFMPMMRRIKAGAANAGP